MTNNSDKKIMCSLMDGPVWCVDFIQIIDQIIEIRGWAISLNEPHSQITFTYNDKQFDEIEYPVDREDIERVFWYLPESKKSGFVCRSIINRDETFNDEIITLKYIDQKTGQPFRKKQNYYYDNSKDKFALPSSHHRRKVHGGDSESSFLLEGYSTFVKCNQALKNVFGKSYEDFNKLLDWGCGCGRMTRYFKQHDTMEIFGADIDAYNIRWCQENLQFGYFKDIPLRPPTELKTSFFDLIIGISIFTHLKEKEQFKWLEELNRISKNGAILLMTIQGNATACRSNALFNDIMKWQKEGFQDLGENPDLGDSIKDQKYYRDILHSEKYIKKNWSKYFDIIEIVPGYIGNHQDLVIMKK